MRPILITLFALAAASMIQTSARAHADDDADPKPPGVPAERLARLARGINLSHWYAQSPDGQYRPERLDRWVTRRDLDHVRALGFTYVRLPFDPVLLWPNGAVPDQLNPDYLARLDGVIATVLDAGLAVMVDVHPDPKFTDKLRDDPAFAKSFATFWNALARHLSKTDPERVFLEVVNEPVFNDAARWWAVQRTLLAAMRTGASRHTLVATSDLWGRIGTLVSMTPYDDRNVVYGFHSYDPFNFTHQGASWVGEPTRGLRRVPYPITVEVAETVVPFQASEEHKGAVWQLGHERWNYAKLKDVLARPAEWGRKHGVAVACTEFGARQDDVLPEHRFTYLRDFRGALEANGIPWAMWDYAGGFGVAKGKPGEREVDDMTAEALWLTPPEKR